MREPTLHAAAIAPLTRKAVNWMRCPAPPEARASGAFHRFVHGRCWDCTRDRVAHNKPPARWQTVAPRVALRSCRERRTPLARPTPSCMSLKPMPIASVPVAEDVADSETYYEHARPEVANVVPRDVRQVVDVGCGAGALGRSLKRARPGIQVRGVEIVPDQAARARRVLDDCHVGAAEDPLPTTWPRPDCVIFADVLEHLVDPWSVLAAWRARIKPGGALVISLPNVLHNSVTRGAVDGRWDYQEAGVLDRTHLRFFTKSSAIEMIEGAGFKVHQVQRLLDVPGDQPLRGGMLAVARAQMRHDNDRGGATSRWRERIADFCTVQFLFVAS